MSASPPLAAPSRRLLLAALLGTLVAGPAGAVQAATPLPPLAATLPACGLGTYVSLVGLDTNRDEALLSLPGASADEQILVTWRPGETSAPATVDRAPGRFGGSIGPGPVFSLARCGATCLQPLRFYQGSWQPLGEPIAAPQASTSHLTYDRGGSPWLVLHGAAPREGYVTAWAFRLAGREWQRRGRLEVTAAGAPGAGPAPWRSDAILSGDGLFSATADPARWLRALPAPEETADRGIGHLLPLGTTGASADRRGAVLVTGDGLVYRTTDGGATWHRSLWTPWETGTAEPWRRGADYQLDVPMGPLSPSLEALWFDRRFSERERVLVTRMSPAGSWSVSTTAPADLPTSAGEPLEVLHTLRAGDGSVTLLFGCVTSGGRPVLVERTLGPRAQAPGPRLVPIRPPE